MSCDPLNMAELQCKCSVVLNVICSNKSDFIFSKSYMVVN